MGNFTREIKEKILVFDGSKGTLLHKMGLKGGECPELWNVDHKDRVKDVYTAYRDAGADVIQTNTFQGNRLKLEEYGLGDRTYELNYEGTILARQVMGKSGYVAASIGPIGKLFEPVGELTFQSAYDIYKEQVIAVTDGGADIINFETFTDISELRVALLAAKENSNLPVVCSVAFEANGKTLMGTDPYTAAIVLKSLGADMVGTNCSFGPEHLLDIAMKMYEAGGIYLSVKPNAGMPEVIDGEAIYRETPEKFAQMAKEFVKYGVRLIGGCCGTNPEFIRAIRKIIDSIEVPKGVNKPDLVITSGVKSLILNDIKQLKLGSINTESNEDLYKELSVGNMEYVTDKVFDLAAEKHDAIYINVDRVKGDELLLARVVDAAQSYIKEPLIIETRNHEALNNALRVYKGKAGVILGSVEETNVEELLTAAKKYGSSIIERGMIL